MTTPPNSEIDELILSIVTSNWQKVAMVIVKALRSSESGSKKISDSTVAARIDVLCREGRLESQGNLSNWRGSEVRLSRQKAGPVARDRRGYKIQTMEKALAIKMIQAALSMGEHLNRLGDLSFCISNEVEQREFRKSLGEVMGILYGDIMMPIIREYPDLNPDK
jgi:Protein of unknown function